MDPLIQLAIQENIRDTIIQYRQYIVSNLQAARGERNSERIQRFTNEANRYQLLIDEMNQQLRNIHANRNNNVREIERKPIILHNTKKLIIPDNLPENIPNEFLCPITTEVMRNPVMLTDGHVYEKEAIEKWLTNHNTSPLTKAVVSKDYIVPCYVLRKMIEKFFEENKTSSSIEKENKEKRKRQPTIYNLFVKERMPILKQQNPNMPVKEIMKIIGTEWNNK